MLDLWPSYFGYLISFLVIGIMWINHHNIFSFFAAVDHWLLAINLVLLLCISFIPFPTALLAEHITHPDERTATVLLCRRLFRDLAASSTCSGAIRPGGRHGCSNRMPTAGDRDDHPALYLRTACLSGGRDRSPGFSPTLGLVALAADRRLLYPLAPAVMRGILSIRAMDLEPIRNAIRRSNPTPTGWAG